MQDNEVTLTYERLREVVDKHVAKFSTTLLAINDGCPDAQHKHAMRQVILSNRQAVALNIWFDVEGEHEERFPDD